MRKALGMIEAIGLTTALASLDAACKAADVTLVGYDKVIGVGKAVSVNIHIAGEVAAVNAAIDAGVEAGRRVGKIVAYKTIARPHEEIDVLIKEFERNLKPRNDEVEEDFEKIEDDKDDSIE